MCKYLILLGLCVGYSLPNHAQNIAVLKGQKRILLVFESDADSNFYIYQKAIETAHKAAFEERDLVVIKVTDEEIYRKYGVDSDKSMVMLIGKDGQAKVQQDHIFEATALFGVIDAMPMRREEMKRQKNN